MDLVRLACIKHAASVHPEPGSNSPTKTCLALVTRRSERSNQKRVSANAAFRAEFALRAASGCVADVVVRRCRPLSVLLPAGMPTAKLTDSLSSHPEVTVGLPALAFCLLFRFQGAEALARAVTPVAMTVSGVGAGPFGRANSPLRRSRTIAARVARATRLTKILRRGDATSSPCAAGGTCRAATLGR